MKIQFDNTNGIINNASHELTEHTLGVFINTVHRWVTHDRIAPTVDRVRWEFDAVDGKHDYVEAIAENDKEREILKRIRFVNHEKDQLWIIFPATETVTNVETVLPA